MKGSTVVVTVGEERTIGPDLMVSTGTWEVVGGAAPAGAVTKGVYINTLVRQGGRWLIASSTPMGVTAVP